MRCHSFTTCLLVALAGFPGQAQSGGSKKKLSKGEEETAKMHKLIEKVQKKPTTERERLVKELAKLAPDMEIGMDLAQWFSLVSQNGPVWDRSSIKRMDLADVFDRMAERLEIKDGKIGRADFIAYGRTFWGDDSPPWKVPKEIEPAAEADKLFRRFDKDEDAKLNAGEMPEPLLADLRRWDRSGDGVIDALEYRIYFNTRLDRLDKELRKEGPPKAMPEDDEERPMVGRAGKLPAGLPDWFQALDYNRDGQIALFEWRRAGWQLDEFQALDSSGDGLLTPMELLRQLALVERDGSRPFAHLLDRRADGSSKNPKSKKR